VSKVLQALPGLSWRKIVGSDSLGQDKNCGQPAGFIYFLGTLTKQSASESEWMICTSETVDSL